ncbi:nuclear factor Y, subunit C9 [Trifolium repens]|nr:nuclear factor Y, subunit C9 [Trifolium repens]
MGVVGSINQWPFGFMAFQPNQITGAPGSVVTSLGGSNPLADLLELSWVSNNLLISSSSNSCEPFGQTSTKKSKRLLISRTTATPGKDQEDYEG